MQFDYFSDAQLDAINELINQSDLSQVTEYVYLQVCLIRESKSICLEESYTASLLYITTTGGAL